MSRPDVWRLLVLAAVAVGVHAWLVGQDATPARDGVVFARAAYRLDHAFAGSPEPPLDVVRSTEHPPGYPLAVCAVARLTGLSADPSPADAYLRAARLANALAGVLLVVPCYLLGRDTFGRNVGFAAALLFQLLPVPARVTSDALSEGWFLLLVASALVCGVRAVKSPKLLWFAACGLLTGAAYLVRPEGLMAAVPAAVLTLLGVVGRRVPVGAATVRVLALAAGVAVLAGPYIAVIGQLTNKPTGVGLQHAAHAGPLFAAWADPNQSGTDRAVWGVSAVASEAGKGTHVGVGVLAVAAVVLAWRRYGREPGWRVMLVAAVLNVLLLLYLAIRRGYVSERHTTLLALLACQLTAGLLPVWAGWAGRVTKLFARIGPRVTAVGLFAILVLTAVPWTFKPPRTRDGHTAAGRWLAENSSPDDRVIDPYTLAEWHAGRSYGRPGEWTAELPAVTYVVLENTTANPESQVTLLEWARAVAKQPGAEVVWQWPAGVPAGEAKLHVWRVPTR